MIETDWATGAYRDAGVVEMDKMTGGIYSGDPGVDSFHCILHLISYLISYHLTIYELHTPSFTPFDLSRSFGDSVWILTAG
jgi:hypothetical protein